MSRRTLLALSAAATAFILVMMGAVASVALRSPNPSTSAVPEEVVLTREAEYRRLIDEANARLRAQTPPPAPIISGASVQVGRHEHEHTREHHHSHHERDDG